MRHYIITHDEIRHLTSFQHFLATNYTDLPSDSDSMTKRAVEYLDANLERKNLLIQAIEKWGEQSQLDMCIEECSELIKAIIKSRRASGKEWVGKVKEIQEEVADVEIMIEQMRLMLDANEINRIKHAKMERLKNLLAQ